MHKKYLSEIILVTACDNTEQIGEWLHWHLNIIGFDHIVLIDNSCSKNIKSCTSRFNNVEYISIDGNVSQSGLYNEYVRKSSAYWVLPIDDDEFLFIPETYGHKINRFITEYVERLEKRYFKIGFTWRMMFSKNITQHYDGPILSNFDCYSLIDNFENEDFVCQKTMVCTLVNHLYNNNGRPRHISYNTAGAAHLKPYYAALAVKNNDFIGTVHNPITKYNGELLNSFNVSSDFETVGYKGYVFPKPDTPVLLHYKYRSIEDWHKKVVRIQFADTPKAFYDFHYTYDKIYKIYNLVNKNCHEFDGAKRLLAEYPLTK